MARDVEERENETPGAEDGGAVATDDALLTTPKLTPSAQAAVERGEADQQDGPGLFATLLARRHDVLPWLRGRSRETWAWVGIIALATLLRFWGLGDKPLHHDESMHAYFSLWYALRPESYWYDPLLHGPFQFHAEGFVFRVIMFFSDLFRVSSTSGNPWINDATARILPATTGVVLVGLTYGLRRELGRLGALIAAFLLAISPAFVYFSRFLREDIYFACFSYATIIFALQFARKRTTPWLVATAVAFILAYATKEAIYLNTVIWLSFLVLLLVWEFGTWLATRLPAVLSRRERAFFGHAGPLAALGVIGSAVAGFGLSRLNTLSAYILSHTAQTDVQVALLEQNTVGWLLWGSILLALVVVAVLVRQIYFGGNDPALLARPAANGDDPRVTSLPQSGLAARIDPQRYPVTRLLVGIPWVSWFVAFVAGWVLFALLYWIKPGVDHSIASVSQGFQVGVGRGIWQGLYYWLQQQQVARGGEPWYYYLLLIPLYEQLAVVFGLAGIVYTLRHPTRVRLFLVYWFFGALALYSWAGEKMPWLVLHILLPLMLLAAIALAALAHAAVAEWSQLASDQGARVRAWAADVRREPRTLVAGGWQGAQPGLRVAGLALGLLAAVLLLIPMTWGMLVLSHQDAANGPHEMMVYVQTTTDVDLVMNKLTAADAALYHGQHQLKIGVGQGEEWPFYWYLRDYWLDRAPAYATFDIPITGNVPQQDVLLLTPGDAATFMAAHPGQYRAHQYQLRSWWDQGYFPPACVSTAKQACPPQWWVGVGPALWLSYGDNPPPHATFNLGRATARVWNWVWHRTPIGNGYGSYDFTLLVRNGVPIQP
ncbi:MAG TPA: flippase activity-associated protein Agl23 [Ktedonobacterales bacterium]|nr:flippase activity-associated protein Agl23 [Ktedonobacterales bacterium]